MIEEVQPPDETPLPDNASLTIPVEHSLAAGLIHSDLTTAEAEVADAVNSLHADIHANLAASEAETALVHHALAGSVGLKLNDAQDALHKVYGQHATALNKRMNVAQADFLNNGVSIPGNALEAQADLADETGTRLLARVPQFAAMMPTGPDSVPAERGPLLILPPLPPPPPLVPPLVPPPPPHNCEPIIAADFSAGFAQCPPGYTFDQSKNVCRLTDPVAAGCPPTSPPGSPPLVPPPPPILPPIVPPIVPPPPPGGHCSPGSPAHMLSCQVFYPPPPPIRFWITYDCTHDCGAQICTWEGQQPPTNFAGVLWPQSWDVRPPLDVYDQIAVICAVPTSPPGSPPTSPPGSPPTSPPLVPPAVPGPPPPPPPDVQVTTYEPGFGYTNWAQPDVCQAIATFCKTAADAVPGPLDAPKTLYTVWDKLNPGSWYLDAIKPITDLVRSTTQEVLEKTGIAHEVSKYSLGTLSGQGFLTQLEKDLKTNIPPCVWPLSATYALADRAETVSGLPFRYLAQGYLYSTQWAMPQLLPSAADVDSLWLTSRIDDPTWECLIRANGMIPSYARLGRDSKTVKPNPNEIVQLYMRQYLKSREELSSRMGEVGVKNDRDVQNFVDLAQQLPGMSDLVRFMVRDAADDQVALQYQYDKDFTQKYTARMREWADAQGIPADFMKLAWRSHWEIPSPTQLYLMYHRLRPDRMAVYEWATYEAEHGTDEAVKKLGPRPIAVSLDDIQNALEVDDKAPFWIPALLAIAYNPITRTDATRAFQLGEFSEDELRESMLDNGYSPTDAARLTRFYVAQSKRTLAQQAGVMSLRSVVAAYREGLLDATEADKALLLIIPDQKQRATILEGADREVTIQTKRMQQKGIRRAFITGLFDGHAATDALVNLLTPRPRAIELVTQWQSERDGRLREPTVRMLCQWRTHGIIDDDNYMLRLQNLGWTMEDARRIADVCEADWQRAQMKAAAQAAAVKARNAKAAEKQSLKELRDAESSVRKTIADYKGIEADLKSAIDQAEKDAKFLKA